MSCRSAYRPAYGARCRKALVVAPTKLGSAGAAFGRGSRAPVRSDRNSLWQPPVYRCKWGVRVCRLVRIGTGTRCIAMHPQLDRVRFDTCESLMDALEECHRQEFLKQALGLCNFEKDELSKCIHHTRLHDANERIRRTRERQKEYEKRRRAREEEVYGKNNYLKKMIEQEAAKKTEK